MNDSVFEGVAENSHMAMAFAHYVLISGFIAVAFFVALSRKATLLATGFLLVAGTHVLSALLSSPSLWNTHNILSLVAWSVVIVGHLKLPKPE